MLVDIVIESPAARIVSASLFSSISWCASLLAGGLDIVEYAIFTIGGLPFLQNQAVIWGTLFVAIKVITAAGISAAGFVVAGIVLT